MKFVVSQIQQVKTLSFEVDVSSNGLTCIVGKNGVGKSTLAKAVRTIVHADTFISTSSAQIFGPESEVTFSHAGHSHVFKFDPALGSINSRNPVSADVKKMLEVELAVPHGERFNFSKSVSEADLLIRRSVVLEEYAKPAELISFLNDIYADRKFDDLAEILVKRQKYYCRVLPDGRYIREDYLSSGEFFLIGLYKKIVSDCKLIFIDEIDISLDCASQVRLISQLRRFCRDYNRNVVFTTHSLAMMQAMNPDELRFMEITNEGEVSFSQVSYNYLKSVLFGFVGWDKYILTEDGVLERFISFAISVSGIKTFFEYKIISIGGGDNVVDLLRRNRYHKFFSSHDNVMAILDGDQKAKHSGRESLAFIPIESVEKELFRLYQAEGFAHKFSGGDLISDPKTLFKKLIKMKILTEVEIFSMIYEENRGAMALFASEAQSFLSMDAS